MYEHFENFKTDAVDCGTDYYSDASLKPRNIELAYKLYRHAKNGTKILDVEGNIIPFGVTVVGRLALKRTLRKENGSEVTEWVPSDESFPSIDEIMRENLGVLTEESDDRVGSILNSKNWSLLANDAWVLGSIHADTEFHFASPFKMSNLWDESLGRITVTAREIIGITLQGYEIRRPNPKLEAVAICVDRNQAKAASLITYKQAVKNFVKRDMLQRFIDQ